MEFNNKKMILAIIIVTALLVLFMSFAFNSIQNVDMDIPTNLSSTISPHLETVSDGILSRYEIAYVDDVSLSDIGMSMLLIDHKTKSACLISDAKVDAVDYEALDKNLINCNKYLAHFNKKATLILNCEQLLGDPVARGISLVYHYKYTQVSNLNPNSVEHFASVNQDVFTSYNKHKMIEHGYDAYFNEAPLDEMHYYYRQLAVHLGENIYKEMVNYDYYDGLKEFVYTKVLTENGEFSLVDYISGFKNKQGLYAKDDEYKVMGLLLCLLLENGEISIVDHYANKGDWYNLLFSHAPVGGVDEGDNFIVFSVDFDTYLTEINDVVFGYADDVDETKARELKLSCEIYKNTIKVSDGIYIYSDYKAIDVDGKKIAYDYITVLVEPYRIKYIIE